jgi:hypothetical protein
MTEPTKSATYSPRLYAGDQNDVRWPPGIGRRNGGHEPVRRFRPADCSLLSPGKCDEPSE